VASARKQREEEKEYIFYLTVLFYVESFNLSYQRYYKAVGQPPALRATATPWSRSAASPRRRPSSWTSATRPGPSCCGARPPMSAAASPSFPAPRTRLPDQRPERIAAAAGGGRRQAGAAQRGRGTRRVHS